MRLLVLVLGFAVSLAAQRPTYEIRGTVTEPGLGGIDGVAIYALIGTEQQYKGATNARGEFVIRVDAPGSYRLVPSREGYLFASAPAPARVDDSRPRTEVSLSMVRLGQIIGRVLDAKTREPVEDAEVLLTQKRGVTWIPGFTREFDFIQERVLFASTQRPNKTDRGGLFTFNNLPPGDYTVALATAMRMLRPQITIGFQPDDLEKTDENPEAVFWPGGLPASEVTPVTLPSGGLLNVGNILLRNTTYYRAHVSVPRGDCPENESARVSIFKRGDSMATTTEAVPCGSELLIQNLRPGSYLLYAVSDWQGERDHVENTVWGTAEFDIRDKNVEGVLPLVHGVVLEGRIVTEPGVPHPEQRPMITLQPAELAPGIKPPTLQIVDWHEKDRFRMAVSLLPQTLSIPRTVIAPGVFVKEVRHNGVPLGADLAIPVSSGGSVQQLDLVIDNKFGIVEGTVSEDGSVVVLSRKGATSPDASIPAMNGTFRFERAVPGEYQVEAVRLDATVIPEVTVRDYLSRLERRGSTTVVVRAGATVTVKLQVKTAK